MSESSNDLWLAFQDGYQFPLDGAGRVVTTHQQDAGSLLLPTGRIVASDPLLGPWNSPFTTRVSPGTYSIHLALAEDDVALVMVLFSEGPPIRWKKAKPSCFSVDGGTGCLMDSKVARFLRQKARAGVYDRYVRKFEDALAEAGLWANVAIGSTANVMVFHTWGGDGTFPAYFGMGDDEKPICLVIDMLPR